MNSNKSVTAYFEEKPKEKMYTLTIEITGRGTTTPSPGSRIYRAGSKKMVSVAPDDGWKFDHWGGDVRSTEKNVSITMSADRRIIAHFIERPKEEIKKSTLAEKNERAAAVKIWVAAQKCVVDEKSKDDYLEELLEEYFEELAKSTYEYCTDPILSYYFGLPNKVKDDIYDLWKFSKNAQSKYYENIEYDRLRKCEFPRLLDEFSNLVQEETECWAKDDLKCASNKMIEEGRKLQYMRGVLKAARYDEFQDRFNPIGNMLFEEWRYLWKEYYKINQNEEPNYMGDSFFRRTWIIEKGEQDAKKILGEKY